MNDQVQIRKNLSKTDFAYTRWYQLPKGHILHVVWQNDTHIKVLLTKNILKDQWGTYAESILTQGTYRYDSVDLEKYIKSLNKYLRKLLNC